jgi:RimJ/RimL family protein N-acetyltransferase
LKFEPLAPAHAADVFRLWSDFETVKFTNWAHAQSLDACAARVGRVIATYAKDPLNFGPFVILEGGGHFVGMIGADAADAPSGTYDVWYILLREQWGKGLATRALGKLVGLARESGRVRRLTADVVAGNPPSARVLEKSGFGRDAVIAGGFQKHGLTLDLWKYGRALAPEPGPRS